VVLEYSYSATLDGSSAMSFIDARSMEEHVLPTALWLLWDHGHWSWEIFGSDDSETLLSFMLHHIVAQSFCIHLHVFRRCVTDSNPDVIWAQNKRNVLGESSHYSRPTTNPSGPACTRLFLQSVFCDIDYCKVHL
jgi:hypothetical protein